MDDPRAQRTLVKSPPELWAEVSDVGALTRHLGAFGEIRITRLEHETTVAWEGDRARGTVELEPSGWGTRVTLTARIEGAAPDEGPGESERPPVEVEAVAEPDAAPEPDSATAPHATPDARPPQRAGLLRRLFGRRREAARAERSAPEPAPAQAAPAPEAARAPEPALEAARAPEPAPADPQAAPPAAPSVTAEPAPLDAGRAEEILVGVLDDLGAARHRPFSRG